MRGGVLGVESLWDENIGRGETGPKEMGELSTCLDMVCLLDSASRSTALKGSQRGLPRLLHEISRAWPLCACDAAKWSRRGTIILPCRGESWHVVPTESGYGKAAKKGGSSPRHATPDHGNDHHVRRASALRGPGPQARRRPAAASSHRSLVCLVARSLAYSICPAGRKVGGAAASLLAYATKVQSCSLEIEPVPDWRGDAVGSEGRVKNTRGRSWPESQAREGSSRIYPEKPEARQARSPSPKSRFLILAPGVMLAMPQVSVVGARQQTCRRCWKGKMPRLGHAVAIFLLASLCTCVCRPGGPFRAFSLAYVGVGSTWAEWWKSGGGLRCLVWS